LDRRLQALETRPAAPTASVPASAVTGDDDATAYRKAYDLLKESKFADAVAAFTQFVSAYPQSPLIDNGYYWLGEAHYVTKDFNAALRSFKTVVEKFPDSRKLPDALLKIGYCQYELKNWQEAREALKRAMQVAANTPVAKLAEQRLAKMQAEGR
jgi:tol-pal system protein YbgF